MTGEGKGRRRDWASRILLIGSLLMALWNATFDVFDWKGAYKNDRKMFGPWILVGLVTLAILWLWRKI